MIACPGCGLPREDDLVAVVPCPVCAAAPGAAPSAPRTPPSPPDPVAGLPADVSQMEAQVALDSSPRPAWIAATGTFFLGIAVGVCGLLAWQGSDRHTDTVQPSQAAFVEAAVINPPTTGPIAVAPMPHAPLELPSVRSLTKLSHKPMEKNTPTAAPVVSTQTRRVVIPLNQPDAAYTLPRPVDQGEHLILRGRVRMLRVNGLEPGAILDASGLEAGSIYVTGRIEGGSVIKLNCPEGVVEVPAAVGGRSRVEIDAPGSNVRFTHPTTAEKPGSRIDGGSAVCIIGRTVDLRGDIDGAGTSVRVTLTKYGSLKVATVRGRAAVEYRSDDPLASDPPATAAAVEPTAVFRKVPAR